MDDLWQDIEEEIIGIVECVFDEIFELIEVGVVDVLNIVFELFYFVDIVDFLEQILLCEWCKLINLWLDGIDGDILFELDDGICEEVIEFLNLFEFVEVVKDFELDDVVDFVEYLDDE